MITGATSDRQTKAYSVDIDGMELFFSYGTCVGFRSPYRSGRIENQWGPTTGRHIKEHGIKDFPVMTQVALMFAIREDLLKALTVLF